MSGRSRTVLTVLLWFSLFGVTPRAEGEEFPTPPQEGVIQPGAVPFPYAQPPVEPIDPPTPVVSLHVGVAAVSAPDAELQYRIVVTNTSRA